MTYATVFAALAAFAVLIALFAILFDGNKNKDDKPNKWTVKALRHLTREAATIFSTMLFCFLVYWSMNRESPNILTYIFITLGLLMVSVCLILLRIGSSKDDKKLGGYAKTVIGTGLGLSCVGLGVTIVYLFCMIYKKK